MNPIQNHDPDLSVGARIGGFEVRRVIELPEIQSVYYELEHGATGARHIHIRRDDHENVFSVVFKTVPSDDTGVAHILEHTALCGSRRFPVRDPFFSMIKRSLNTFMNAFTASDWTMYPFATQNRKDFYNLMDVYLDAAFYPNLSSLAFLQEGHRLETEGDALVFKGVVFNEMKGAMSSPHQIMGRGLPAVLFPDTTYHYNSGGDPARIPDLTHEQLVAFHRRHYHPSNAFFFTYGDFPLADHLAVIEDRVLRHFERIDPRTDVPSQPRWAAPREATFTYPLSPEEKPDKKCQAALAWLTADIRDSLELLALSLLSDILLGNPGAPLRKALIDSGLGSALSDATGLDADCRDAMFSCGLKDVAEADIPAVEKLILDTLTTLADGGIDPELAEAAIHQLEFRRKEVTNTPHPYGLKLILAFCGTWLHAGDPVDVLRVDRDLGLIRESLTTGRFFEERIRRWFLENPHRVLFRLIPDHGKAARDAEAEVRQLAEIRERLTPADLTRIDETAEALRQNQEAPEDPSVLPTLALSDIPPLSASVLPANPYGAVPAMWFEQPTSGIFYFTAAAGLGNLPADLTPWVPFFCSAATRLGTSRRDYAELARLLDRYTGGVGFSAQARTRYEGRADCVPFVSFTAKCLNRNEDRLFEIIGELLTETAFSDLGRMRTLLMEYRAGLESSVVSNGHGLAMSLAARNFSPARQLGEIWSGVHQLHCIKDFTDAMTEATLSDLGEKLRSISRHIFTRQNVRLALIGEDGALLDAVSPLTDVMNRLPTGDQDRFYPPDLTPDGTSPREGWSTATAVSFVARAFMTPRMDHEDSPALAIIAKMLRSLYLHREIREKGGAYGGFSSYSSEDGLFCLGSYRDPRLSETLAVFDGIHDFLKTARFDEEDVKEAILQICADIDHPDAPAQAARKAFYRRMLGLTDAMRNRFKEGILSMNRDKIREAADRYFASPAAGNVVISNREALEKANAGALANDPLRLLVI